jgi:hypothetical protein
MDKCDKCKYSVIYSNYEYHDEYVCHRHSPIIITGNIEHFRFPHVFVYLKNYNLSDWCGEFELELNNVE